ncbi:hypothetical protein [Actinomadura rugatobispora]|uniref:Uncharacterized protein n=1 Tax=Actinomadura rugatobispora TaxID=1994 RepID=A0ABW0ZQ47_9ACTN
MTRERRDAQPRPGARGDVEVVPALGDMDGVDDRHADRVQLS